MYVGDITTEQSYMSIRWADLYLLNELKQGVGFIITNVSTVNTIL